MRALVAVLLLIAPAAARAEAAPWSEGTAHTLPVGRLEAGVFSPVRYGLRDGLELSAHPLWMFVSPNVTVKLAHGEWGGWAVASTHGLSAPTPLLRMLAREGTGGVIAPDVEVPWILGVANHLVVTHGLRARDSLTLRAGARLAPRAGDSSFRSVDWHFAYPRTVLFRTGVSVDGGARYEGWLAEGLGVALELDGFWLPGARGRFAVEQRAGALWRPSAGFSARLGYVVALTEFPFGVEWSPIFPTLDLVWAWDAG